MKMFISLLFLMSIQAFASDVIVGKVLLDGKTLDVSIDTNINTGKEIVLDNVSYQIMQINNDSIMAVNLDEGSSVAVIKNQVFTAAIVKEIVAGFELSNASEVKCTTKSKAFLVLTTQDKVLGNCVK